MKYPYDIFSLIRQKTFSIEAHFVPARDESPMKIFDSTFSRFVFTVLSDGSACYFNVHIDDLPGMRKRTEIAVEDYFKPKKAVASSPAFTERFVSGKLKGKTPVDILLEDPEKGMEQLKGQYDWLKQNLEKFPNNRKLMEAIREAAQLDKDKLRGPLSDAYLPIQIAEINVRPLRRKKRADGLSFCYEGSVVFDPSKKYPVCVTAKNYYAPVQVQENGTLNVNLTGKDKSSEKVKDFHMTADEWLAALDVMESSRNSFRTLYFGTAYKKAEEAGAANRAAGIAAAS